MYPNGKQKMRVYVLNHEDRERIDQLIFTLRCALDAVFLRREADLGKGTIGNTAFDDLVDEALWAYNDVQRDPDF